MNARFFLLIFLLLFLVGCKNTSLVDNDSELKMVTGYYLTIQDDETETTIFIDNGTKNYKSHFLFEDPFTNQNLVWEVKYIKPDYCFTSTTYKNWYCITERAPIFELTRNFFNDNYDMDGIASGNYFASTKNASLMDMEILMQWLPSNFLSSFIVSNEFQVEEIQKKNFKTGDNLFTQFDDEYLPLGTITNIYEDEQNLSLPSSYIDLMKMAKYVADNKLNLVNGALVGGTVNMEFDDSGLIRKVKNSYRIDIEDFRENPSVFN